MDPMDLGGGEPEAGPDVIGHDLDLGPPLTSVGLPAPLLQAAGDEHPAALGQAEGHVLGQVPPADDVEEGDRLLPLLGVLVLPPAVDGDGQRRGGLALPGVADLRIGSVTERKRIRTTLWSEENPPLPDLVNQGFAPVSTLPLFPTRTFTLFPTGLRDAFYSMAAPFARRRVASSSLS